MANTADGLLHILAHDPLSGVEGTVPPGHAQGQKRGVQRRGDLRRAGGLGSVAEDYADSGEGVGNGVGDNPVADPYQVGQRSAGTAGGGNGSAEGGQIADKVFQMNGNQIADSQGPVQLLLGQPMGLNILDHRDGHGDALIAASGVDHHRQRAT